MPDWDASALVDLNLDGIPDVLLQNKKTGEIYYWIFNGTSVGANGYLVAYNSIKGGISPSWKIVGTPDLDDDGWHDLLLQNQTNGAVQDLLLLGSTGIQVIGQGTIWKGGNANWKLVGVTDLANLGKPTAIFRYATTGQVYYWQLGGVNGAEITDQGYLYSPSLADWNIVAPGK